MGVGSGIGIPNTAAQGDTVNRVRAYFLSNNESGLTVINIYVRGRWK